MNIRLSLECSTTNNRKFMPELKGLTYSVNFFIFREFQIYRKKNNAENFYISFTQVHPLFLFFGHTTRQVKLWAMPCRASQNGQVMVESSDQTWSNGEGNGKPLKYSCLENPMNSMKRKKDMTLKDGTPQVSRYPVCFWRRAEK